MRYILYILFLLAPALYGQTDTLPAPVTEPPAQEQERRAKDTIYLPVTEAPAADTAAAEEESALEDITNPPSIGEVISPGKVIWAIIFLLAAFYVIRIISLIINKLSERSISYRITLKGIIPVVRIVSWMVAIYIVVAGIFAPPVETILLITGSLGIALGFASQDIFKNIFGGVMILFDRPFQVGDKIQIGSHYGEVISIGLRSIRIVTPDDSMVSIPNGEIMTQSVSNSNTGAPDCQVVAELYLPAYIDIQKAKKIAERSASVSQYVYLNKPIVVIIKNEYEHGRPVLKMRIKAYVLDIRYEFPFMSEMTERTLTELLKAGVISKEDYEVYREG